MRRTSSASHNDFAATNVILLLGIISIEYLAIDHMMLPDIIHIEYAVIDSITFSGWIHIEYAETESTEHVNIMLSKALGTNTSMDASDNTMYYDMTAELLLLDTMFFGGVFTNTIGMIEKGITLHNWLSGIWLELAEHCCSLLQLVDVCAMLWCP